MKKFLPSRLHSVAFAVLATFTCAAAPSHAQSATHSSTEAPAFREVIDETGRSVRIPQPVRRIVSLAPSLTETIYALGFQDRLVGDTDQCDYPLDAQKKTKVGGGINPSVEVIASLHPDLVLVTKSYNRLDTVHSLEELGIASYATDPHSVADILSSIKTLADLFGVPEAGASVAEDMQHRLDDLQHRIGDLPPKRVLFVVWTQPLISTGQHTFLADALRYAGAVSIVNSSQDWPQVNLEEVAKLQPNYLVFAESQPGNASREVEKLATLPGWKIVDAVRYRHYAQISDAVNRPAPRIVSAVEELARQLHPEAFAEKLPVPKKDTKKEPERENPPSSPLAFTPFSLNLPHSPHRHPSPAGGCSWGL
ncbi:MAG TPA: helical backbone metal receptor [Candidatus Acidoferrum sp.]|nr:helical backbone metal receptor [Candidatus Acidoferrum sp.]